MDKQLLNQSKYFEKIEINWFSVAQMRARKKEFRNFYQEMLEVLYDHEKQIIDFIKKGTMIKYTKKTRKKR